MMQKSASVFLVILMIFLASSQPDTVAAQADAFKSSLTWERIDNSKVKRQFEFISFVSR